MSCLVPKEEKRIEEKILKNVRYLFKINVENESNTE